MGAVPRRAIFLLGIAIYVALLIRGGSARREFVGGSSPGEAKPERATGLVVSWRAVATESGYRTWIVARAGPPEPTLGEGLGGRISPSHNAAAARGKLAERTQFSGAVVRR